MNNKTRPEKSESNAMDCTRITINSNAIRFDRNQGIRNEKASSSIKQYRYTITPKTR